MPSVIEEQPALVHAPDERRRFGSRNLLGLAVSVVSLAAVIWWARRQEAPSFPSRLADLVPLAVGVLVYAVATLVRGWRWHTILRQARIDHKTADAYALTVVGYMGNNVLPARGGEALRVLLLGARSGSRRREILGSIIAERLLDLTVLIVLFAIVTWAGVGGAPVGQWPAAVAVGALAVGAIALAAYFWRRRLGRWERFSTLVRPFALASRMMISRVGIVVAAVTAGLWMIEGTVYWLVGQSLNLSVNPFEGLFLVVLTSFFVLIPAAPGYVGTFDAALLFALHSLDVRGGSALGFVLLVRFIVFVPITIAGVILVISRYGGASLLRIRRPLRA